MPDAVRRPVLIVEDEDSIADALVFALSRDGFEPVRSRLCSEAEQLLAVQAFDFVVLDVGLPDGSGFELCRRLRTRSEVPVLFLTARGDEIDRIVGLEIGADDYVVKPFSPREVVARVRTILRRARTAEPVAAAEHAAPAATGWSIDSSRLHASYCGKPLSLTLSEFRLLESLHAARGRICTRSRLLDALGDAAEDTSERTIDSHVRSLRAKLRAVSPDAELIETHRGSGYALRDV